MELSMFNCSKLVFLKIFFYLNNSEKMPDFISLLARIVGPIIYALVVGWKLALVFLSVSPFIVLAFNLTVKVGEEYRKKSFEKKGY